MRRSTQVISMQSGPDALPDAARIVELSPMRKRVDCGLATSRWLMQACGAVVALRRISGSHLHGSLGSRPYRRTDGVWLVYGITLDLFR